MRAGVVCLLISAMSGCANFGMGEHVQLRNQAIGLMNRAGIASKVQGGRYNFRTKATFTATAGEATSRAAAIHAFAEVTGRCARICGLGSTRTPQLRRRRIAAAR